MVVDVPVPQTRLPRTPNLRGWHVRGGHVALTCWEAVDPEDQGVLERLERVNMAQLANAGFAEISVRERRDRGQAEHSLSGRDPDPG